MTRSRKRKCATVGTDYGATTLPRNGPNARQLECLRDLARWFEAEDVRGVIIGGIASSLLGRARPTKDVDALVSVDESILAGFADSGTRYGFDLRKREALDLARK